MDRYVGLGSRKLQRVAYNNFSGAKRGHGEILKQPANG
jgi:hypothetical protein